MIPARAPRTFLDQIAEAWRTRPAGAWIGAAASGFYQLLLWKLPMAGNAEVQTWHWAVANLLLVPRHRGGSGREGSGAGRRVVPEGLSEVSTR